jgi:hypothetical protein
MSQEKRTLLLPRRKRPKSSQRAEVKAVLAAADRAARASEGYSNDPATVVRVRRGLIAMK